MKSIDVLRRFGGGNSGSGSATGNITFVSGSAVGTLYAQWTIGFDGWTYQRTALGVTNKQQQWITPAIGMDQFEVMASVTSGDDPPGDALDTWLSLDISRQWGWFNQSHEKQVYLEIQLRDKTSLDVVADVTVQISNSGIN
jgi:hypothetical protein